MVMVYIIYLNICFEPTEVHNTKASSYDQWLPTWLDHLLCKDLGVPLATDKLQGPSTSLSFLGIILNTHCMEIRLPSDKLSKMQDMLKSWLSKEKTTKKGDTLIGGNITTCHKSRQAW